MIPDRQTFFLGNGLELVDTVILRQRVKDSDCPAILKIEVVLYALASCALNRPRQLSAGKTGRFHRENLYQAVDSLTVNTAVFVWIEKMYCIHPAVLLLRLARVQSGFPPTSGVLFRVLVSWR